MKTLALLALRPLFHSYRKDARFPLVAAVARGLTRGTHREK